MEKYMKEKYLLVKTRIMEESEIRDCLSSKCVELTQEDIDTMTHDNYYGKSIEKFRKVFE